MMANGENELPRTIAVKPREELGQLHSLVKSSSPQNTQEHRECYPKNSNKIDLY